MSNTISSATNPLADMMASLTRKYDSNGDAQLSSEEFGAFLSDLIKDGGRTNSTFAPGTAARTASAPAGRLEGFDAGKLADPSHQTLKYQIGRILEQHPNTPQGLREALPAIEQLVPGVRIIGTHGDKLDFGEYTDPRGTRIGVVDVLAAAGAGGRAWQWVTE